MIEDTAPKERVQPAPYEVAGVSQVNFVLTNTYYQPVPRELQGPAPYTPQAGGPEVSGPITGTSAPPGAMRFRYTGSGRNLDY